MIAKPDVAVENSLDLYGAGGAVITPFWFHAFSGFCLAEVLPTPLASIMFHIMANSNAKAIASQREIWQKSQGTVPLKK